MAKNGGFFSTEGAFFRLGTFVFDCIWLNILWILLGGIGPIMALFMASFTQSLPPVVFWLIVYVLASHWGVATTALFYALGKRQRGTDSYPTRDFWHAYKSNYKQALPASMIITALMALLAYNLWLMYYNFQSFGVSLYIVFPLEVLVLVELLMIALYLFPLLARFEMSVKDLFRYSFFMANKHLPYTLLVIALFAGCFALLYYVSIMFIIFVVAIYTYVAAGLLERVFRNYMPSEDEDDEDLGDFSLDAERQAIIDRYMGRSSLSPLDDGEVVRVDENDQVIKPEEYKVVKVEKEEE